MIDTDDHRIREFLQEKLMSYLEFLQKMVKINSFTSNSPGVNQLGLLIAQVFNSLDFQTEFVQSTNPIYGKHLFLHRGAKIEHGQTFQGSPKETSPSLTLACISHLDTVFSPEDEIHNDFHWRKIGDRIYGPGVVDIKGGTAMIFMILDALKTLYPIEFEKVNWILCMDASEEVLSSDFAAFCKDRLPPDTRACLVFEGGTLNDSSIPLLTARKGRATFKVEVIGRSAHAGNYHRQGANAILQIAHTIQAIQSFTDYDQRLTFNVGTVNGGTVVNRVPHYAEASVEMRALTPSIFKSGFDRIMALDGSSQVSSFDGFPCKVAVHPIEQTAPWPKNNGTDRLLKIWAESAKDLDVRINEEERGGLSDGNLLWESYPTLDGLGPTGANAHCSERTPDGKKDQEYVLVSSFVPKALLDTIAILKLVRE